GLDREGFALQGLIRQGCRTALAAVAALLVCASCAHGDAWRPIALSCVSFSGTGGACAPPRVSDGLWKVGVAPGGATPYGIAYDSSSLLIFDRDPATGELTQRGAGGCLSETGSSGQCLLTRGLQNPTGIVVSPDGRQIYVTASFTVSSSSFPVVS